jgi:hypothetical protein
VGYADGTFLTHNVGYGVAMTVVLKGEPKLMHMLEQEYSLIETETDFLFTLFLFGSQIVSFPKTNIFFVVVIYLFN